LEERTEASLEIVFDADLDLEELIERVIETIFGDDGVGDAQDVVEAGRGVPVLGQGELAARLTEPIDDFDGDDVGGGHGLFALRDVSGHDGVQADMLPQPACQPDVAEASGVGPTDVADADADDVRIIGQSHILVIGEKS
jgi:hypothetical protein